MAYIVNKYNGVAIATVQDGTVDHTTDLTFIGKNYAGYGEVQNENFLHLLENFANTTEPPRPVEGQIWYDKTSRVLKFHDGFRFKAAAVEYGSTIPTNPSLGDLWWDSTLNKLYSFSGSGERSGFHLVGPDNNTSHISVQVRTVRDTTSTEGGVHDVVEIIANGDVVAIFNNGPAFDVLETDPIDATDPDAFRSIKQGITLRHTLNDPAHAGVSHSGSSNWQFWGTASDASKLGGVASNLYALTTGTTFTGVANFNAGLTVKLLTVSEDSNNNTLITKTGSTPVKFSVNGSTNLVINAASVAPDTNATLNTGTIDLGTTTAKWKDIWASGTVTANAFTGILTGNVKDSTGSVLLDNTAKTFKGSIKAADDTTLLDNATKTLKGNLKASDDSAAYDSSTKTFTGSLTGTASSSSALKPPTTEAAGTTSNYPPAITALNYTTVVRDGDGKIYASSIDGNAKGADKLFVSTYAPAGSDQYRPADIAGTANTIAARDGSGNLTAVEFKGTASAAYYADLAEKYLTDADYETGTVVVVGGSAEVTACSVGGFAIGVVSKNPAYMMNSGLVNGTYIALKGRVPTKVVGAVNKGDRLIAAADGCATANNSTANHCFGIALESSSDIAVKLVEVLVL
jgi:hypothetical protein